jgi:hypothetical protein
MRELPLSLQSLVHQLESEEKPYPERARDLRHLDGYIQNGDFDMARHVAGEVIKRQQALARSRTV